MAPKPNKSELEKEYKTALTLRDAARKVGNRAALARAEKRMAEIQVKMFHETARTVGASDNPKDFDRAFKRVAELSREGAHRESRKKNERE